MMNRDRDAERVLELIVKFPGKTGAALGLHGLGWNDSMVLAALEADGLAVYVKDHEMSGWYVAGGPDAKLAQELADERHRAAELARKPIDDVKYHRLKVTRKRYQEKARAKGVNDGNDR